MKFELNFAPNKRVVGMVSRWHCPESCRFRVWVVRSRRNPTDSAAHAEHYAW